MDDLKSRIEAIQKGETYNQDEFFLDVFDTLHYILETLNELGKTLVHELENRFIPDNDFYS